MQRFRIWFSILLLVFILNASNSIAGGNEPIPSLKNLLEAAQFSSSEKKDSSSREEMLFEIKKFYYQIQYQEQKLEILDEVKGHFEKAVEKAEEKYDEGEEDVSQSDITKLKLGLAGTLNDLYEVETELQISRLSLSDRLKNKYSPQAELVETSISPLDFEYVDYQTWVSAHNMVFQDNKKELELRKLFLKVIEARKKMKLARKNRKMTRALLVSEVANYDFGIGDSGDLFQALIIYTRVLSGYYSSIYKYNLSIATLDRNKNI
ncbi:MAG: TolC family protein [Nitrospinota bacterium]